MANNPYGVTVGLNPPNGQAANNYAFWSNLIPAMNDLGLTWLRFQISWQNIELTQGVYTWGALDDAVSHCNAAGINIEYTIRGAPAWALLNNSFEATNEPFFQMDPYITSGFVQQVCQRYNGLSGFGTINAIGWNEDFNIHHTPSNGGFSGTYNSPSTLYNGFSGVTSSNQTEPSRDPYFAAPVLIECYPIIKKLMPPGTPVGAPVVYWTYPVHKSGAPPISNTSNATDFVNGLYSNGAKGYFDFLDIHYYSGPTDPLIGSAQVNTFQQCITDMKNAAAANGDTGRPIWVSEFGRNVPTDVTAQVAAQQYFNMYSYAARLGVGKMLFFTLDYSTSGISNDSIVIWNGSSYVQQPAYAVVKNFISQNPSLTGKFAQFMVHR